MNVKKQTEKRMTERITNKWIEVEQIKENKQRTEWKKKQKRKREWTNERFKNEQK